MSYRNFYLIVKSNTFLAMTGVMMPSYEEPGFGINPIKSNHRLLQTPNASLSFVSKNSSSNWRVCICIDVALEIGLISIR
jgi:hypothetical protein